MVVVVVAGRGGGVVVVVVVAGHGGGGRSWNLKWLDSSSRLNDVIENNRGISLRVDDDQLCLQWCGVCIVGVCIQLKSVCQVG